MKIIQELPPNYGVIKRAFRLGPCPRVIFAYGHTIYNPAGIRVGDELVAHEAVHGTRQGDDIDGWWDRYIRSPSFRLEGEIPAHIAEYQALIKGAPNRNARRGILKQTAKRLASPLYGRVITVAGAKRILRCG